jgi:hypothetical protein
MLAPRCLLFLLKASSTITSGTMPVCCRYCVHTALLLSRYLSPCQYSTKQTNKQTKRQRRGFEGKPQSDAWPPLLPVPRPPASSQSASEIPAEQKLAPRCLLLLLLLL